MALESLILNKVRSFLTTLGMIIGVFSVIVMIGIGQASQAYITQQVKGLGSGVLIITPGNPKSKGFGPPGVGSITLDDAVSLNNLPGLLYLSPNVFTQTTLKFERNSLPAPVIGSNPEIIQARGFKMGKGRFFTQQEARSATPVIVLGKKLAADLFKDTLKDPLGSKIKIKNQRYRVIGVLKEQGSGLFGSVDDQAFMPTRTFQQSIKAGKGLNSIFIKVKNEELLPIVLERAQTILRYRHAIREDEDDDFKVQTQAEILSTVNMITQVFTFLLAGIAAISLLVGGIGIMNIMLVSVTERTREIGIRKSVGARRIDILMQFLIESGSISLLGGTIGIITGLGMTSLVTNYMNLPFIISPAATVGAFIFSAGVGVFFGLYPANKASKLDPVEALRYE